MEDIIKAFGIDGRLIFVQIVNFAILMVALVYFLYNPILNMLKAREEKIIQGIKDAEAAAVAKASADAEKKVILTDAHSEAAAVNARAKTAADATASDIVARAQTDAAAVIADAAVKAEQLKAQAERDSAAEIAKTAILAAEKILSQKNA
jgi:F-type H+-transporting ATPase subunit b